MNFNELAQKRFSCRAYLKDPVSKEDLDACLEAGRLAPSACNLQPVHIIVVQDEKMRRALGEAYNKEWFYSAPVILVVCTEPGKAWCRADKKNYADIDGSIVMDHITLCASYLGLGTCWIGAFTSEIARKILQLPAGIEPLVMTPLGKPAQGPKARIRKKLDEMVHWEQW